jgi:hypothetical protein
MALSNVRSERSCMCTSSVTRLARVASISAAMRAMRSSCCASAIRISSVILPRASSSHTHETRTTPDAHALCVDASTDVALARRDALADHATNRLAVLAALLADLLVLRLLELGHLDERGRRPLRLGLHR